MISHHFSNDSPSEHVVALSQDREGAAESLHNTVPEGNGVDAEGVCCHPGATKGSAKCDPFCKVELHASKNCLATSSMHSTCDISPNEKATTNQLKRLKSGPTREIMDGIMAAECREWVANVVGDTYGLGVLQEENFIDALRSGVVLLVLLQKLLDPPVPDDTLKIPRRSKGFYARENVVRFLKEAACTYGLLEAQLFTVSDLCDGKNDRAVVTCLFSIARIAYARGITKFAPHTIVCEQEIEARLKNGRQEQADTIALEPDEVSVGNVDIAHALDTCCLNTCVALEQAPGMEASTSDDKVTPHSEEEVVSVVHPSEGTNPKCTLADEKVEGWKDDASGLAVMADSAVPRGETSETKRRGRDAFLRPQGAAVIKPKFGSPPKAARPVVFVEAPVYRPRKWDKVDVSLSVVVNIHFSQYPFSQIRFRRLSACVGAYVVYHRTAGRKKLLYARIFHGQLMIQPKGTDSTVPEWEDLKEWLQRYELEISGC